MNELSTCDDMVTTRMPWAEFLTGAAERRAPSAGEPSNDLCCLFWSSVDVVQAEERVKARRQQEAKDCGMCDGASSEKSRHEKSRSGENTVGGRQRRSGRSRCEDN